MTQRSDILQAPMAPTRKSILRGVNDDAPCQWTSFNAGLELAPKALEDGDSAFLGAEIVLQVYMVFRSDAQNPAGIASDGLAVVVC